MSNRLLAILVVAVAACGGDTLAPPTIYGTYDLQTVDAKPLPTLLLQQGDYTFKATAGFYTLRENGTFSSAQTWREDFHGWSHVSTHSFEGTFTVSGDSITFVWPSDGRRWIGVLDRRELTVPDDDVWLYSK